MRTRDSVSPASLIGLYKLRALARKSRLQGAAERRSVARIANERREEAKSAIPALHLFRRDQQLQQTGMLFMHMQQTQPAAHMEAMQSQQAWIIEQQAGSPLVQVMHTPSSVISHLHMPIIMLQQQTIMPFIIMQQLHMPPAIMVQRFCIIVAVILSSHLHVIFIPSLHFSIFIVQRGTIIHCGGIGIVAVPPIAPCIMLPMPMPIPGIPMPARSIIIELIIAVTPSF
jgi:hypothetical protein